MEIVNIDFRVSNIYILPSTTENNKIIKPIDINTIEWKIRFGFEVKPFGTAEPGKLYIPITLNFGLHYRESKTKKPLLVLAIKTGFVVGTDQPVLKPETKLQILMTFYPIAAWQAQGVFAAQNENSVLNNLILPEISFDKSIEQIKQMIQNGWN